MASARVQNGGTGLSISEEFKPDLIISLRNGQVFTITLTDSTTVGHVLEASEREGLLKPLRSLDDVLSTDAAARELARNMLC